MRMRKDAGAALFALAVRVTTEFARLGGPDTVWNIGSIALKPGAANVVPSEGEMMLEFRDTAKDRLDLLERTLLSRIADANESGPVKIEAMATAQIPPTAMTADLGAVIAAVARDRGEGVLVMPSGAGHDAMVLGRFMPAVMLFIPSIGGRSHDIVEDTAEEDIILGCEILAETIVRLGEGRS